MSLRQPPRLAAWLLRRCLMGHRGESLLGDLFEEYQTGRPPRWYWRETLAALLLFARREARELLLHRAALMILALIAQSTLLIWLIVLTEGNRERCPAPPVLLSGAIILVTAAGLAEAAISLVLWLRSRLHAARASPRPGLIRLAIVVLAAIGFGGGALSWASTATASCSALVHAARADLRTPSH